MVLAKPFLPPFNIAAEYTARNSKTRLCEFGLGRAVKVQKLNRNAGQKVP
jgi:hypothetical protein